MSKSAPWNYQPQAKGNENVQLFNPQDVTSLQNGQLPNATQQSSWNTGWENQYGQYNNLNPEDGGQYTGEGHTGNQNDYQLDQGQGELHQFYNLNPGIQQQTYDPGQFPQFDQQGQPIYYDPEGRPLQQYDSEGQPIQQFDSQGQPIQLFVPQGQGQNYQTYDDQGNYGQQYDWNHWNNYGFEQSWSNAENGQEMEPRQLDQNVDQGGSITAGSEKTETQKENDITYDNMPNQKSENNNGTESESSEVQEGVVSEVNQDQLTNKPQEISSESLVTLNYSSNQISGENSESSIENQMKSLTVQDNSENESAKVNSGDINHSAVDGQVTSLDSQKAKDSPVNSQTSDDWEMVPSAHNLLVPTNHSRQGSTDSSSNVHFFIGSTNISPSATPSNENTNKSSPPSNNMIPKHASSPMPPKKDDSSTPPSSQGAPPPLPPPASSTSSGSSNPFRKGNHPSHSKNVQNPENKPNNKTAESDAASKNKGLKLNVGATDSGFPSPIPSVSEESQNSQSQSPIMPRKESPFQPPRRSRNLSQSSTSNSIDEENGDQSIVMGSKSEHTHRNSVLDRKLGGERRAGPLKADRSIGSIIQSSAEKHDTKIDYNKYSNRGHDEKRPRSPLTSSTSKNISTGRLTPTKPPSGRTTPTKPSSGRTTPGRSTPSRRIEREAYQKVLDRRRKENISPATSLWSNEDVVPTTNILLAPALLQTTATVPLLGVQPSKPSAETREVLSPVQNLITSMTDSLSRENSPEKELPKSKPIQNKRENPHKDHRERNSSIDREIALSKQMEEEERYDRGRDRSYRDDRGNRGPVKDDRNPAYRDDRYRDRDYKDRDYDRDKHYEAYYERQRAREKYYDDRYERPRSRQSTVDDRAPSRQDQGGDKSRTDRDAYYRDRYGSRGYYDYYGKQYGGYYDQRYADYYGDNRYNKAYYDEYYAGQYPENYDRMSRYDYTWQNAGYYDQYRHEDSYSQRSDSRSRAHTPGSLSDSGDHPDAYNTRSSSRHGYPDDYRGHYDPYYYGYGDYYNNSYMEPEPPGRLTPEKYTLPHMCARFGPGGQLVKVMPNRPKEGQTATVEIHDISMILEDQPEVEELKCFPGPLVRVATHKNDVLSFCHQRAKACSENINMTDRESAELIWKLLELLIKQNGMIVGTDIADLLLDGHETTTAEYSMMGMKISNSTDNLELDLDETNDISNVTVDRSVINRGQRSIEEVTDRFRHLLLYGRKKDALEWSMKNNLWGHALFLASKMDTKAHANVMTRFANSAMKMNDPLQTLYQLMSGRQPAAVSCITDERWGDWRPHLAMILSNQTHRADIDRKSIMTMGDTLASRGFLHASHFCYLMAQVGFGSYHKKTSKMVLVGSNHSLSLSEFATNEAIQCSEVYEYAMSLGNASFFSPNLQYFKFLYACRMAESGFAQQALEYCEVIANCINISPTIFQPTLVKLVYELASRLKKFDPEKQQMGEDSEDPMWLQHLHKINQGFEDGSIQPLSGSATPYCFSGTRSSSASGEVAGLTDMRAHSASPFTQTQGPHLYNQGYNTDQSHHQGFSNEQHQQGYSQTNTDSLSEHQHAGDQSQHYGVDQSQYQHQQGGQIQQTTDQNQGYSDQGQGYTDQGQSYVDQGQMYSQQQNDHQQQQQQQQYYTQEGQSGYQFQHHDLQTVPESTGQNQGYTTENQTGEAKAQNDLHMYNNTGMQGGDRRSISSVGTMSSHADTDDEESLGQSHKSDFDYFGAATKQQIVAPRLRKRTESESSQVNPNQSSSTKSTSDTGLKENKIPDVKDDKKNQGQKKGWFGGVFSKLIPKSKNEMKLPDDKDPSIVWDPVKKRWTNQDGGEEDDKPAAPPPKDMDLSAGPGSTAGPIPSSSSSTPAIGGGGGSGAPPMGNRYGRPRGRGVRGQYVDVLNPKPAASNVPSNLFNVMPTSASSPAIFNPSHSKDISDSSQQETAQPTMPPSDQTIDSGEMSKASSSSSLSREIQQYLQRDSAEMPPPSGPPAMPMLFNPSQMKQPSTSTPQQGLKKYNQRRQYPKS